MADLIGRLSNSKNKIRKALSSDLKMLPIPELEMGRGLIVR